MSQLFVAIKNPELAAAVLTQDLVFEERPLAALQSTVHRANNRSLDWWNCSAWIFYPTLTLCPLLSLAGSTGLSKVSSVKSCWYLVLSVKTLHGVFQRPGPQSVGVLVLASSETLEAMSLEMELPLDRDACSKLPFCSEEHDLKPHFTLSEEQEESRSSVRHRQAKTFFCKQTLLNDVLFDATGGTCACDRVDHSHSSISCHIPELYLSLTDSVSDVSYRQCKQKPCLCERQKSLCKHYLLSAQYRFSICNKLSCVEHHFFKSSHYHHIANVWYFIKSRIKVRTRLTTHHKCTVIPSDPSHHV